jgi:DNA-binding SARP family transcriptional activator
METTTVRRRAIAAPLRLAILVVATIGLVALVWRRPVAPPDPWARVRPEPRDLIASLLLWLLWLAVAYALMRLLLTALRPPRIEQRVAYERPRWARRRPERRASPSQPSAADPLLELFARPVLRSPEQAEPDPATDEPATIEIDLPRTRDAAASERPLLRTLGQVSVLSEGKEFALPQNTQAILAYLAVRRRRVGGEEIAQALWPDHGLVQSRQRVWRAMRPSAVPLGEVVSADKSGYELRQGVLDVDEVERLVQLGEDVALERALALFAGEPFAGLDFEWLTAERAALDGLRIELLERLATLSVEERPARGLAAALQLIAADRFNEAGWRLAMAAEAGLGRRQAVVERYEELRSALRDELGLSPQPETRSLYRRLLGEADELQA